MPEIPKRASQSKEYGLDTEIQYVKGVGPKLAERFKVLGIETIRDLLWHIPHTYQDRRAVTPINQVKPGEVATVRGIITSLQTRRPRRGRHVREIIEIRLDDGVAAACAVWFNQSYIAKVLRPGLGIQLHGKTDLYNQELQFSSPDYTVLDPSDFNLPGEILPVYPGTKGLPQRTIRRTVAFVLARVLEGIDDLVPERIRLELGFPSIQNTWRILHQPGPEDGVPTEYVPQAVEDGDITLFDTIDEAAFLRKQDENRKRKEDSLYERARQRLAYEEFLLMQYFLARARHAVKSLTGIAHPEPDPNPLDLDPAQIKQQQPLPRTQIEPTHRPLEYLKNLPFQLTTDQWKVLREIQEDMTSPRPMNRLLQGDVGSGKTVVAIYAMLLAASGGRQAALMAPTEILAAQHHATVCRLIQHLPGVHCGFLSGNATPAERRELIRSLQSGTIQLLVGTHAMFEDPVTFERLGLVVVDEQHRFGVEQRRRLLSKGEHPDLLLMTATPIPRTLALSWYGDMDTSMIRELPAGRPKVITRWTSWDKEEKIWSFIDEKIREKRQVYIVCPLIEDSERLPEMPSADQTYTRLSEGPLKQHRIALLHGQLRPEEKSNIMERFANGAIDVLISTTVIEVGIDVANATIITVLGADRFGLAQLHQLRGRVGRGTQTSYCILVTGASVSPIAERRLRALESTRDGFRLAEEDLRLRGPGEMFGQRQSGLWAFKVANQDRDLWLLERAREDAARIMREDAQLQLPEHRPLALRAHEIRETTLRG